MKKQLFIISAALLLTGCSQVRQNEESTPDWQTAYSAILLDIANSGEYTDSAFSLLDINGDDVPELFVSQGTGRVKRCFIYTFSEESILLDDELGEYGYIGFDTAIDQLVATDAVQGHDWRGYYELRGDSLEFVQGFYNNYYAAAGPDEVEFHINGENVTEEEYRTAIAEYSGHEVLWLGRDNELTAETASAVAKGKYN